MSDQQQQQQAAPAPATPRPAAGAKKSLVAKLTGAVAGHPRAALAMIAVLAVLLIITYVYYHGFLVFGPYAAPSRGRAPRRGGGGKPKDGGDKDGGDKGAAEKGDAETERLIESINSR